MPEQTHASRAGAISELERALEAAEALEPNDRLRLIARLWASLPADHWAAPTPYELHEFERQLRAHAEGQLLDAPWDFVRNIVKNRSRQRPAAASKLYSAPRRFDLFTIMIVTAAYAVLLSLMSALGFPPVASSCVAVFVTLVAIGQAILFGGNAPRLASVLSGTAAYFLCTVSLPYVFDQRFHVGGTGELIAFALVFSVVFGSVLGYVAGVLVGGVFLVADVLRKRYGRQIEGNDSFSATASDGEQRVPPHPLDDLATPSR